MGNKSDFIVYIGRFSPYHHGHHQTAIEALKKGKKLIFCIGSANAPRTIKNPWTVEERIEMIFSSFPAEDRTRVICTPVEDRLYQNNDWATAVREVVRECGATDSSTVRLVVAEKDDTSWYINLFPDWEKEVISVKSPLGTDDDNPFGATKIRELLFTGDIGYINSVVPPSVFETIKKFSKSDTFAKLRDEYRAGVEYEALYENTPNGYATNFYTADSVVYQSGHVLLIRRKHAPGKDLWALPGGHVNPTETAEEASLRELKEETGIKVPVGVLKLSLKNVRLFDHPDRSMRARITGRNARTVSVSHFYRLDDTKPLPKVKAGDDAKEAWWFPVETVKKMRDQIFEDHMDQILYHTSMVEN